MATENSTVTHFGRREKKEKKGKEKPKQDTACEAIRNHHIKQEIEDRERRKKQRRRSK